MKRIGSLFVLLLACTAAKPLAAAGYGGTDRCTAAAVNAVSRFGIARPDIKDILIDVLRNEGEGTSVVTDVQAWMTVRQCAAGNVVVQMTPGCILVEEVYTRGGCAIRGITQY